ncbi:MSC_0775 family lipoprotein [Mycoplasmopsis pulmonis]|uniref:MSC_0775 family lipoprotein n=1 Tax=Mycoplasmopsis pulmonis TaxID=2107 RepID=UPI002ACEA8C1|nr:hypothetical protein [Mycoplasmopsis pulmonis]MDZ7293513.1 hypothetical protein [Mycoplasmopsis pulmonis]
MSQKAKKSKNKFKKLLKLLSIGTVLPLVASFGVVACSIPTEKENQKNTDTSQSTNPSNTAETNSSSNNLTSPIKAHKQLPIDYNKSAYQLNKFLELNLDKHLKVEIENNFDISNVLAKNFNKNQQWKRLKLNTNDLKLESVQKIIQDNKIDLKKFDFKIDYMSLHVDPYDSRKVNFNINVKVSDQKNDVKLFSLHKLKREHTGFKEDDSNNINYSQEFEKYFETNKPSASLKNEKNDISFSQLIKDFESLEDDDFSKLLEKRKTFIKEYVDLVNFENEQDNVSFLINKVELDHEKLNSLKLTFRLIKKTNEVIQNVITKEKKAIYASKELALTLLKENTSALKDEDKQKFVELNAKLRAYDYTSPYNFDFENMEDSTSKVIVDSTNDKIKYHVLEVTKNDQYTRSWKVKITSISEDPKLDKIEFVKNFEVPNRAYVFSKELQDKSINYLMDLGELKYDQLTEISPALRERLQSPIVSGGWLDDRSIYSTSKASDKNTKDIHLGEDILVEQNKEVLAPFDGKIIASYYAPSPYQAYGLGVITVLEVMKKDLIGQIDQSVIDNQLAETDRVYIAFMHLNPSFLEKYGKTAQIKQSVAAVEITPATPKSVKKGDVIGLVGEFKNNGGWMPHVHIEVSLGSTNPYSLEGIKAEREWSSSIHNGKRKNSYDPLKTNRDPKGTIKPIGVARKLINRGQEQVDPITLEPIKNSNDGLKNPDRRYFLDDYHAYERWGLLNPNLFFRFNDESALRFNIFDNDPNVKEIEPQYSE